MSLDTEQFLNMTTDAALETQVEPCPEGEWLAMIGEIDVKDFEYKKGDKQGQTGYRLVVPWEVQDEGVKEQLDRDRVTVTQSILLDVTEDGNALDMGKGKNIQLGRLREALGQNEPGKPWSPAMLNGQIAKIDVKHELYEGNIQQNVKAVKPA